MEDKPYSYAPPEQAQGQQFVVGQVDVLSTPCVLPVPESGNSDLKEKSRPFAPTGLSRLVTPVSGGTSGGCLLSVKEDVKGGKKEDKSHNTQGD